MKDEIKINFAECEAEITCAVCDEFFYIFPATEDKIHFNCPKCNRYFRFNFNITPLTIDEVREYETRYYKKKGDKSFEGI